jgi:cysteine synthase B
MLLHSLLDKIGNTPLVRIRKIAGHLEKTEIYAKIEYFNPGGSIKDRAAFWMIVEAEKSGALTRGKIIMDPTSGNTGVAYAMIGAAKGYAVELVLPSNASEQRKRIARAFGANLTFSSPLEGSDGAIRLAHKLKQEFPDKYFMPDQYNNPNNPEAHARTTAPEIWRQTGGRITHFVATMGTSGTVMGTGRGLKGFNAEIEVIGVEPDDPFHGLEGLKHMASSIVPGIYDEKSLDRKLAAST